MPADIEIPTDPEPGTPLIFGAAFGADGARPVDWAAARNWTPGDGRFLWLHLDRTVDGVEAWLRDEAGIDEETAALLVSNETRPRAFCEGSRLVAVLCGVNLNPGSELEDMIAFQIWSDGARVLTFRRRPLQTPRAVYAQLVGGSGAVARPGGLVAELIAQLTARLSVAAVAISDQIDALEDAHRRGEAEGALDRITEIRRDCLALRRYMSPQHEALGATAAAAPDWFSDADRRAVDESRDRLARFLDNLEVSKESALVLQDDLNNRAARDSSRTMYVLSVVAAIFLPLSFVTGLLGINVGGMPGVDSGGAFWLTVALLAAILVVQLYIFRRLKWL